jgi:hypothetical protein
MRDAGCQQYGDQYLGNFNTEVSRTGNYFVVPYRDAADRAGLGGSPYFRAKSGAAGADDGAFISFDPAGDAPTNRLRLWVQRTQATSIAVVRSGGVPSTLAIGPGDEAFAAIEYVADVRANQSYFLNQTPAGNGEVLVLQGLMAYDSQTPALDIINASVRGSGVQDWANTASPHSYLNSFATIDADLTIIVPPINDLVGGTALSTFQASLDAVVAKAKQYGDVLLGNAASIRIGGPNNRPSQATRDTYTAAMEAVRVKYGLPPIMDFQTLGPWDAALYRDDLHQLRARSQAMGQYAAATLLTHTTATGTPGAGSGSGGVAGVSSVNNRSGAVTLSAGDVGLGNADNTSDASKPVSTAQQQALDLKASRANNLSDLADFAAARTNLGATTVGAALFTAASAAAGRTALGATSTGASLFTAADATAARNAINAPSIQSFAQSINFTADGSAYVPVRVQIQLGQGNAPLGTGTLAYAASTAADPGTFNAVTLPVTVQGGAWLRVTASGIPAGGFLAVDLYRTA